jgi:hypothetical protein
MGHMEIYRVVFTGEASTCKIKPAGNDCPIYEFYDKNYQPKESQ